MTSKPIQIAAVVVVSALAAQTTGDGLVFEDFKPTYDTAAAVRFNLRNFGDSPLWLDSSQADMFVVERRREDLTWETGNNWRCGNAGAGTPRMIDPGDSLEAELLESWAFHSGDESPRFETEDGHERPVSGLYRIVVRYSRREWSDLSHIPEPEEILEVVSPEFVIKGDR